MSYLILLVFLSLFVNQTIFLKTSWLPYYQEVAKNCVEDLRKIYHRLPQSPILYILRPWAEKEPVGWVLYKGELFKLVFRDKSIRVLFEDAGDVIPKEAARRGQVTVLAYNEKHLYDVTQSYLGELWNPSGYKLVNFVNEGKTSFDYSEYYPSYDFDTPGKRAVFVLPIVRKDELRVAMTTIAGARISFKIAQLTENSKLMVGTAMKFDLGDGAEGRIYFEHDGSRELIYKRFLDPAHNPSDRQWADEVIDLGRFNGKYGSLIFECSSGPKGNTVADWYGWSTLRITHVSDMKPDGLR